MPQNETQTKLRIRKVQLPSQNLQSEVDGEDAGDSRRLWRRGGRSELIGRSADGETVVFSKHGHSLEELLVRGGHYSGKVRREAFHGLQSLLSLHGISSLSQTPGIVVQRVLGRLLDSDAGVREACLKFLQMALPLLSETQLSADSFFCNVCSRALSFASVSSVPIMYCSVLCLPIHHDFPS